MELESLSNEQLIERYKNARTTYYACGGHHKASENEWRMRQYSAEMAARGIPIPPREDQGKFNGVGAF